MFLFETIGSAREGGNGLCAAAADSMTGLMTGIRTLNDWSSHTHTHIHKATTAPRWEGWLVVAGLGWLVLGWGGWLAGLAWLGPDWAGSLAGCAVLCWPWAG